MDGKQIDKENIEGVKIKNQQDFTYEGNQLEITVSEKQSTGFILVERKDVNGGKIEVTQYHTRTIIENFDLTDEIRPFAIQLVGKSLSIIESTTEISIGKFDKEFTFSQFSEKKIYTHFQMKDRFGEKMSSTFVCLRVLK
ncbi:hypothetical protein [Metabacillus arenae]|uniref:DUF1934 domain-containing protein n=1 Tax=Metabacillus arenae TaxID=2771434 RepID=A0A926RYQ7_9BACI|nr:hypothetical protein [Metabacillus arenae]MBD1382336.1 hypothetical protein [Metabacillus arenae]